MTIAIHTKYIGPTDKRGARISATCVRLNDTKRVLVGFDHALDGVARHAVEAHELVRKHFAHSKDWPNPELMYAGETLDGKGFVFTVSPTVEPA